MPVVLCSSFDNFRKERKNLHCVSCQWNPESLYSQALHAGKAAHRVQHSAALFVVLNGGLKILEFPLATIVWLRNVVFVGHEAGGDGVATATLGRTTSNGGTGYISFVKSMHSLKSFAAYRNAIALNGGSTTIGPLSTPPLLTAQLPCLLRSGTPTQSVGSPPRRTCSGEASLSTSLQHHLHCGVP